LASNISDAPGITTNAPEIASKAPSANMLFRKLPRKCPKCPKNANTVIFAKIFEKFYDHNSS